ncbi:MAG TPA: pilus assembly protein PilM [Candidatus Elarobacter sp.]|jgi:Tfp pilus assembly PilM family ATPase|nr:pilus assembly protein PilM [Candidatus Elarobacter sp.]
MRGETLPLGVDIGAARTRVALLERDRSGSVRLIAVAARETAAGAGAAIDAARAELGTRERRCVLALGGPDTHLRVSTLPGMRGGERVRAARYEAAQSAGFTIADAAVRVVPVEGDRCVVGIARRTVLVERLAAARAAGLRPVAVDDAALALRRVYPHAGAIVDVGVHAATLVLAADPVPACRVFAGGGEAMTAAIVAALGLDPASAEARKRSVGTAGAGEHAREALVEQLAAALIDHRSRARREVDEIVLVGNGSRTCGLAESIERAVAVPVRLGSLAPELSPGLPPDVVRAAAPDWALAYGLGLWECAA